MKRGKLVPIGVLESQSEGSAVSGDLVYRELNKIIAHPIFSGSAILCKFLVYVVSETLSGNAGQIKEYTIALHVLNKPVSFDVKKDGIVRIHACRLRKALADYYKSVRGEEVFILIPKGSYIATFHLARPKTSGPVDNLRYIDGHNNSDKVIVAILPFKCYERRLSHMAFCVSLEQKLSVELGRSNDFTIISNDLDMGKLKFEQSAKHSSVQYALAGYVHFKGKSVRVFVRLTQLSNQYQVWSDIYHFEKSFPGYFELYDLISSEIIGSLTVFLSQLNQPVSRESRSKVVSAIKTKLLKYSN